MSARTKWWLECRQLSDESAMLYMAAMKARDQGRSDVIDGFADMACLYAWRARQMRSALLGTEPEGRLKCLTPSFKS